EPVAFRKQSQDLGARGAEGAVPRTVFRKRRRWKSCWLVGEPVLARDHTSPAIGARPREHLLSLEQIAERGDRADGRKRTLAGPVGERSCALDVSANGAACCHWAPTKGWVTSAPVTST